MLDGRHSCGRSSNCTRLGAAPYRRCVLDLLFPHRCLVCGRPGCLCQRLRGAAQDRATLCTRCGAPTAWPVERCRECTGRRLAFTTARGAVAYDDAVRVLVRGWKERGLRGLAALAAAVVVESLPRPDVDALACVPPDGDRSLRRGHHPAGRLAQELGSLWGLPVAPLLGRTRALPRQRGLPLAERRRNVRGAFTASTPAPGRVCLVDDVYTSGATVGEAASALRRAGARASTSSLSPAPSARLNSRQAIKETAMRLQVKGRNVEVTDAIQDYAERKLGKLEKQLADPTRVELELMVERNPSIAENHIAEATIWTKGPTLRAREASPDMKASIDQLVEKLERQVKRYRQKRRHEHDRHTNGPVPAARIPARGGRGGIRDRQDEAVRPQSHSPEEAVMQLELVGHDFFVFRNADSGEINVVYRRRDGDYGLIEPA